jgi:hypothetical protein
MVCDSLSVGAPFCVSSTAAELEFGVEAILYGP